MLFYYIFDHEFIEAAIHIIIKRPFVSSVALFYTGYPPRKYFLCMNIAHYSYDNVNNPRCGGGGAYHELMIHKLLARNHTITFYNGYYKGAKSFSESGIRFSFLGFGASYLLSRISFSFYATIHSFFVKADIIVIGYSVFSPVLAFLFRRKRTILEFYHMTGKEPFRKYSIFGVLPWIAERCALVFGKQYLTLTDSMAEYIKTSYPKKITRAVYTGYDITINSAKEYDDNYILCFGRIDIHMKGIDILIDAFEKIASSFTQHSLKIAGRGSDKDISWLEKRIKNSVFQDRIIHKKNVSEEEKHSLFHHATFVCMPSRFEGWNISAVEAAASSKATIGTQIMGLRDSIRHNETGILVPPEDSNALADTMKLLLSDASLRERLGKKGFQWAQNFTWEKVASVQEEFYYRVLQRIS